MRKHIFGFLAFVLVLAGIYLFTRAPAPVR